MKSNVLWDCLLRGVEVHAGIIAVMILIALGLELYAFERLEQASAAGFLLLMFLASWISVLGITYLALIPTLMLVRVRTSCR